MSTPVRDAATALLASGLESDSRVLVTGAGGWFGHTLAAMLTVAEIPSMFTTHRPRAVSFGGDSVDAVGWDLDRISAFAPTTVVDCAFVLRDYLGDAPLASFTHENSILTSRLLQLTALDSVATVVSVSSGAAVHPRDAVISGLEANPYGYLKRQAELAVTALGSDLGKRVVIARPWSLSGSLVTRPERYAFSDLILQARSGAMTIAAGHRVSRRYVGVDDFFAVVLASQFASPLVLNSAGELVEFQQLAERINATLGASAVIRRAEPSGTPDDDYFATDDSWHLACAALEFEPASLNEQILAVDDWLAKSA